MPRAQMETEEDVRNPPPEDGGLMGDNGFLCQRRVGETWAAYATTTLTTQEAFSVRGCGRMRLCTLPHHQGQCLVSGAVTT